VKIRVLGSSAGGGFPQWNCNCANCAGVRNGTVKAVARTQSSIAVTQEGRDWLLINASPDILAQIKAQPALQPARAARDTGIAAVMLIDAQVDHVTGLLMLRERSTPLPLYATREVLAELEGPFPITRLLSHYCGADLRPIGLDPFSIPGFEEIEISPLPILSKAPPYSRHRHDPRVGDNIALTFKDRQSGKSIFYAPGLGELDAGARAAMQSADVLLVDGTFWTADELVGLGFSEKYAADMGHLPQFGPGGMIEVLDRFKDKRRILIHINNTNPILREDSAERALLAEHGIEVAFDGMEVAL
jgi:pyrroloquinoline quinone biosynthesis protein B